MIGKGNFHSDGAALGRYLVTGKAGERAELVELRGFASADIETAFLDVQVQAYGTRCQKPFFHCYTRLAPCEELSREQWLAVADRQEKRLGLAGQPRAVSFHHQQDGSTHMHIAWSRIDAEQMRAIDPGLYKLRLKDLCRQLEKDLGLQAVRNERKPEDRARAADRKEFEQSRRLGTDIKAIRNAILDCIERSDSGKAFNAALAAHGLVLANGDRRDCFVIVDREGGHHALNKKLTGQTLAETRKRLGDLDRTQLPSVEQAQTEQHARHAAQEHRQRPDLAAAIEEHERVEEALKRFGSAAARAAETVAPIFDRDAADIAWLEKVALAGIASADRKDEAARTAPETRGATKQPEPEASAERAAGAPAPMAPKAEMRRPDKMASRIFGGVAKAVETVLGGLFSFFAAAEPKLTAHQAELAARAAQERAEARAHIAAEQEKVAAYDWMRFARSRQEQQEDLNRSQQLGGEATREASLNPDTSR